MEGIRFCFLFFIFSVPTIEANIAHYDEFWQKRAEEAKSSARVAYRSKPEEVINQLNHEVHLTVTGRRNNTRKLHKKYNGPCMTTNPIDQCWRCDRNWAKNRQKLAECAQGFGRKATGGKDGKIYVVTDPSDNDMVNPKPGTLRHAVIQLEPLWIIFERDMVIQLAQELIMTGNKTIDGRGAQVHIAHGAGLTLQFVQNIILHSLKIHDIKAANGGIIRDSTTHQGFRTRSDGDGISLFGAVNVWIDHISMSNCQDGLIDLVNCSTAVTISNCHFTHHNDVLLFGASDTNPQDEIMQVTVVFTHFGKGLVQRMPRCRFGFAHILNNDYTHWLMYAIGGSSHPTILCQGNRFVAPADRNAKEVTKRTHAPESEWKHWIWKSDGDLLTNGAFFVQSGDPGHKFKMTEDMISPKPGSYVSSLTRFSGALNCVEHTPC
ncbi:pectate lyase-like [Cynara cardunculus var. scolymus]|uniref:Pectate lyase n=1 Tax=Cynara cardunculus var. scolymus TaxID=59895 RepID=A0A124SE21_CYNCS|nr:pectate lyase-like [Cynara cardunculus var. scolymus]KVH98712.1 AmbAllergen [Cynara cardunculus var. scolymus]